MKYKQYTPEELANEPGGDDSQSWYDYKNEQEEERAKAMEASKQIKVGDHVRLKGGEYIGKVEEIGTFYIVLTPDGASVATFTKEIEVAPRLTPDEAWAELPYTILAQINQRMAWGALRLLDYDQRQIRHEAYKLLGGAGIKVTEEVKERVRKAVKRIADAMGLELA